MKITSFLLSLLCFVLGYSQTEIVSDGIINTYGQVVAIDYCNNSMELANGQESQFGIGDKVLIIQMKGADLLEDMNSGNGTIEDYLTAGAYEINEIKTINFGAIDGLEFKFSLTHPYDANGAVQVIDIPQYANNVQFNNTLSCLPWDGNIGGIVTFDAGGEVILNAGINVDGLGFRGAEIDIVINDCYNSITGEEFTGYDCFLAGNKACGGQKGEGIGLKYDFGLLGIGRNGNGGGGGNNDNGGGGGGSNAGFGGRGGDNDHPATGFCEGSGGHGGDVLDYDATLNRIFLGGGGGAGYNGNGQATGGGNGGGLVFITANSLSANGFSINANGNAAAQAGGDGAGGSGAGGTVILNINTLNDALIVNANGGKGGDIFDNSNCPGVGGGGGGGSVWIKPSTNFSSLTNNLSGGLEGAHLAAICIGVSNGVQPGQDGDLSLGFTNNIADVLFEPLVLTAGSDALICIGESAQLTASVTASSSFDFEWVNDNGNLTNLNETVSPTENGLNFYTATATSTVFGTTCIEEQEVTIIVRNPNIVLTLSPDTPIYEGQVVFLNAAVSPANPNYMYVWSPSELVSPNDAKDALAEPFETTEFCLTVTDEIGCEKTVCEIAEVLLPFIGAPNAFSPNGDGDNDVFRVVPEPILNQTALTIYNRWGEIVYNSREVFEWDGTKNGEPQPEDVYLWSAELEQRNTGEVSQQVGELSLIR